MQNRVVSVKKNVADFQMKYIEVEMWRELSCALNKRAQLASHRLLWTHKPAKWQQASSIKNCQMQTGEKWRWPWIPGLRWFGQTLMTKVFIQRRDDPEHWQRIFFGEVKGEMEMILCAPQKRTAIAPSNEKWNGKSAKALLQSRKSVQQKYMKVEILAQWWICVCMVLSVHCGGLVCVCVVFSGRDQLEALHENCHLPFHSD